MYFTADRLRNPCFLRASLPQPDGAQQRNHVKARIAPLLESMFSCDFAMPPDPDILNRIVGSKRSELAVRKNECPLERMIERAHAADEPRGFLSAIRKACTEEGGAFICEMKRASPSAGKLREDYDVHAIAESYERNGAACLSILTDSHFEGSLSHLVLVRNATSLPLLRKDFMLDPYQIYESRAAGADAVLLLASVLGFAELKEMSAAACALGMDCLGEVHDEHELETMLETGIELIGINNRDLKTFEVSLERTATLCPLVPEGRTVVSESGISTPVDVARLRGFGVSGYLVGGSLMESADPGGKLAELMKGLAPGFLAGVG